MKTQDRSSRQNPSGMPIVRYRHFLGVNPVSLPDRAWSDNRILKAPRWLSTDLRDGNQALIEPMDPARKKLMFELLIEFGLKGIEIGFPVASTADLEFCRTLVEEGLVPEDVMIFVLTQSRQEIIHETVDALEDLPRAVVHLYNIISPVFRRTAFHNDKEATKQLAVTGTQELVVYMGKTPGDDVVAGSEYSPEISVDIELDFALEVYEAAMDVWQSGSDREIVINLSTTVERCTSNVYVDQIEYMSRNLSRCEHVVPSAHSHNDRGMGIATVELVMLAGVDRVEDCLFGQGERTGNVDLITLAPNLFSQGTDPGLNLSDIDRVCCVAEHCTQMDVPPCTPYGGDLVYTPFSDPHQDAIEKGFADRARKVAESGGDENAVIWDVPYFPLDPKDVSRVYEAVVRVNSQSGKGGASYLLLSTRQLDLPRCMQIELSGIVQRHTDKFGGKITVEQLRRIFADEHLPHTEADGLLPWGKYRPTSVTVSAGDGSSTALETRVAERVEGKRDKRYLIEASSNGPISAFVTAPSMIGADVHVLDYVEHTLASGRDATAAAYVECDVTGQTLWGCGIDPLTMRASFNAIISVISRVARWRPLRPVAKVSACGGRARSALR